MTVFDKFMKKDNFISLPDIASKLLEILQQDDVESRPLWKPMHMQPIFKDCLSYTDGTSEKLFNNGLCLPSGSNLTQDDLHRVLSTIIKNPSL